MPQIIENGHLFIAQPPLYKAARGRSEVYLKDEAALDQYLVDNGVEMMRLDTAGGSRTGQDLRALVDHARRMRTLMRYVPRSEEHTSELQSLMRISYAVFCLKKKKKNNKLTNTQTT